MNCIPRMPKTLSPSSILEAALYSDDLDAAEHFYGTLLNLEKVMRAGNRHVFFKCGQGMLLIFNPAETNTISETGIPVPPHGAVGPGHMCFSASDKEIDEWIVLFENNDIDVEMDFKWPNGARSIYVRDPYGNSIEFAEPKLWGF